ncbi:hypothetical protein lerEdw1_005903 [Lerista edwardsae]|nr:hypothetical protein lerEdw1_005903 [Lerista edwardsae]
MKTKGDAKDSSSASSSSSSSSNTTWDGSVSAPPQSGPVPFPRKETIEAIDLSLDGLLYPKHSDEDDEEEEEEEEEGEQRSYLLEEEEEGRERHSPSRREGCSSPTDKDALDRVLDTFLTPSSPHADSESPPATWSFFGSEMPEFSGALLSRRPDGKAGDAASAGAAGLSPPPPPSPAVASSSSPWKAAKGVEGAAFRSPKGKAPAAPSAALPKGEDGGARRGSTEQADDAADASCASHSSRLQLAPGPDAPAGRPPLPTHSGCQDFLNVPILPLNPAYLAARTRQLLDLSELGSGGGSGGPFGGHPRAASPPSCNFQDLVSHMYSPKEGQLQPYMLGAAGGDFQPPFRIKEESLAAASAKNSLGGAYLAAGKASPTAIAVPCTDYAPLSVAPPQAKNSGSNHEATSLECILYKAEAAGSAASYGPAPCKASTSGCIVQRESLSLPSTSAAMSQGLYQPIALQGPQQLASQPAGLKDSLPQLYPPYLSYIR